MNIGLATINAGVLGAVTNGAVPTSQATSTLYGVGIGGQVLGWSNVTGGLAFVATSTSGGGLTAIGPTGQTQTGPSVTFATSSTAFNGLTASTTIVGSGNTLTFTNTLAGTLGTGAGGTGLTATPSFGQILRGTGSGYTLVATTTLGILLSDTTGILGETRGGTNQSTYATGDILYASGANTLSKLTLGTAGTILASAGGIPSWVATSTLSTISGTLAVGKGGTGLTTFGGTNTLLYTTVADALSSITTGNNGVLITSAGGIPSISSTLPSAVQTNITSLGTLGSVTVTGLSTLTGGFLSSASSTINSNLVITGNSTTTNATTTNFAVTGITSSLLKTNGSGSLLAAVLGTDYLANSSIDTSSEIATIVSDETGSGALVFGTSPTLSGITQISNASTSALSAYTVAFGATATSTFSSAGTLTLAGLANSGLGVNASGAVYAAATTTAGTGLSYSGGSFSVNTSQNISTLSNLTTNGFVRTSGGTGALSVQTDPISVAQGGTGATTFGQGWLYSNGGTGALAASTSPTVNYITATSTTATSTFAFGVSANRFNSSATSTLAGVQIGSGGLRISTLDCSGTTKLLQTDASGNLIWRRR